MSTLGYGAGSVVANQAFVPSRTGDLCSLLPSRHRRRRSTSTATTAPAAERASPRSLPPLCTTAAREVRLAWSQAKSACSRSWEPTGGAPAGTSAVIVNLTAIEPDWYGYIQVYPCGSAGAAEISSINFAPLEVRANTVVVPVASSGTICLQTSVAVSFAIDVFGYFSRAAATTSSRSTRSACSTAASAASELNRATEGQPLGAGQIVELKIAGTQGVPAYRQGGVGQHHQRRRRRRRATSPPTRAVHRPTTSNVNIAPTQAVTANGAMVKLSSDGDLCIYSPSAVHVIVDINGVWL